MGLFDKFKAKPKKEDIMPLPQPVLKPVVPEDLPEFPVDNTFNQTKQDVPTLNTSRPVPKPVNLFEEPEDDFYKSLNSQKNLPRQEEDMLIKDFVSPFPSKPFVLEKPYLFEVETKPVTLKDLEPEDEYEKISPVEKPYHFDMHETVRKPLFIRTDRYKQTKRNIDLTRNSIKNTEESIFRMENLKSNQDSEFELFHRKIEDVQRKLIYTDRTIFKEW
jgi:hypothetical protein